ncbi:response regulator transcription factor [Wukongibacter baidiensis]|uniref:response regulator transcription factor n=1 Tax=Wukongibacter baidiensis TaxID=1723361 RepID=UPI003D7FA56B
MYKVFLVEDEQNLNDILVFYLENEGYEVKSFVEGLEAEKSIHEGADLWILDIMLPDMDGYELIKKIKAHNYDTPVIFISARDKDLDKIVGLRMGSDDYIAKPFLPIELVIRVGKLLERVYNKQRIKNKKLLVNNTYTIDFSKRIVYRGNTKIDFTSREFDLLCTMVENRDNALSREYILERVWGKDYFGSDRVVDDLVRRIRKKLPKLRLETIYGYGYRWCASED